MKLRILLIALISTLTMYGLGFSQWKNTQPYYLSDDSTAIKSAPAGETVTSIELMPDTVPEYLPRSRFEKFNNKKFHFLAVSPDGNYAAFAAGEGDQWMGVLAPKEEYMKFLLYSIKTNFFGAQWTPDSRYLAFAYHTPDRRYVVQIVRPPEKFEQRYQATNAWQTVSDHGEQMKVDGWKVDGADTNYTFVVSDSAGNVIENVALPVFRDTTATRTRPAPKPEKVIKQDQK